MSFNYNNGVPATANNPSVDQPDMLINTQSIEGILNVDHITFRAANGGTHKQVTFNDVAAPGAQMNPQSIFYTVAGTASTNADLRFRNQNAVYQGLPIKAWALVNGATGAIILNQSFNVDSVTVNGTGSYTVNLTANALGSANFSVIGSTQIGTGNSLSVFNYELNTATSFNIFINNGNVLTRSNPVNFSFAVIQV